MIGLSDLIAIDLASRLGVPDDAFYPRYTKKLRRFPRLKFLNYLFFGTKAFESPAFWLDVQYLKKQTGAITVLGAMKAFQASLKQKPVPPSVRTDLPFVFQLYFGDPSTPKDAQRLVDAVHSHYSTPLIDRYSVMEAAERTQLPCSEILRKIAARETEVLGCYAGFDQLESAQKAFLDRIEIKVFKEGKPRRRHLLFVQAGKRWKADAYAADRSFDILANFYEDVPSALWANADYAFSQRGTKFSSIYLLAQLRPQLFRDYEYVWFIDDDVEISNSDLEKTFSLMEQNQLDLAQPSLSASSASAWKCLFQSFDAQVLRPVSGVEIMAFVFSKRFLNEVLPKFAEAISGYGLDFWFGKLLLDQARKPPMVLSEVQMTHIAMADQEGGPYYRYLRSQNLNVISELYRIWCRYQIPLGIIAVSDRGGISQ